MKDGITKGYLTYKLSNDSSKGYIDLKQKLLDEKVDVPLRYEKLKSIITGKNEKGENLWNNGNPIRTHRKHYQIFIQKNKPELWEEITKFNLKHQYRDKMNRQGHSNSKKSYWAIGYDTLQDFYELSKEKDINEYKKIHNNCCGLGDPKTSIKNLKKIDKKKKRKEFREKKKSEIVNKKDDIEKKENLEEPPTRGRGRGRIRGRGRGGRGYFKSRGPRGRPIAPSNIINGNNSNKVIKNENKNEDDEEDDSSSEDNIDEGKIAVGRKKKKNEKKLKQKEKEEKKMNKKINKLKNK